MSGLWVDSLHNFSYNKLHDDDTKFCITEDSITTNTSIKLKIVKNYTPITKDGSTIIPLECLDVNNQECVISIVIDKSGIAITIVKYKMCTIYIVHKEKVINQHFL